MFSESRVYSAIKFRRRLGITIGHKLLVHKKADGGSFAYSVNPHDEEELCIKVLKILVQLIKSQKDPPQAESDGDKVDPLKHLFIHYDILLSKPKKSAKERLQDIQNFLNRLGATDLFIHLIQFTSSDRVFEESLNLATTILDGGNNEIQTHFLKLLRESPKNSEEFFRVVKEKMDEAQQDLKNGASVSTDDLLAFKRGSSTSSANLTGLAQISNLVADEMHDAATGWLKTKNFLQSILKGGTSFTFLSDKATHITDNLMSYWYTFYEWFSRISGKLSR